MSSTAFLTQFARTFEQFQATHAADIQAMVDLLPELGVEPSAYWKSVHFALKQRLSSTNPAGPADQARIFRWVDEHVVGQRSAEIAAVFWLHGVDAGKQHIRASIPKLLDAGYYVRAAEDHDMCLADKDDLKAGSVLGSLFKVTWAMLTPQQRVEFALDPRVHRALSELDCPVNPDEDKLLRALTGCPELFKA